MARRNPFIRNDEEPAPREDSAEVVLHDELLGHKLAETGPSDPECLPITPKDVDSALWPMVPLEAVPVSGITVMGLHGGAGATTVAGLLGEDVAESGRSWPRPPEGSRLGVLAVCRSHWRGLEAADQFTQQWAAGMLPDATLLGLLIVDDGPSLAEGQKKAMKRLLKRTPRGYHIPWVEAWRHASPDQGRIPARITRMTRALRSAAADL